MKLISGNLELECKTHISHHLYMYIYIIHQKIPKLALKFYYTQEWHCKKLLILFSSLNKSIVQSHFHFQPNPEPEVTQFNLKEDTKRRGFYKRTWSGGMRNPPYWFSQGGEFRRWFLTVEWSSQPGRGSEEGSSA